MNILKVSGNGTVSPETENLFICVDLFVSGQINYSVIGTFNEEIDDMTIILVRRYEQNQVSMNSMFS